MTQATPAVSDLLRRWQPGWAACRDLPTAPEIDGTITVILDLPGRYRESFVLDFDERPQVLPTRIAELRRESRPSWLTVATRQPAAVLAALTEAGLAVLGVEEQLMSIDLRHHPEHHIRPPFQIETAETGQVAKVRITTIDGQPAAEGMIGLNGADAIAHAISTEPAYRRQGLAGIVMSTLARHALSRGATTGLLIASAQGQALYRRLGWTPQASILTATCPTAVAEAT